MSDSPHDPGAAAQAERERQAAEVHAFEDDVRDYIDSLPEDKLQTLYGMFQTVVNHGAPRVQAAFYIGLMDMAARHNHNFSFLRGQHLPTAPSFVPNNLTDFGTEGE